MMHLIMKDCVLPLRLQKFEALLRSVEDNHWQRYEILMEYKKWLQGFRGEESVMFYLDPISNEDYRIYHDIRLPLGKYYFQIDILLTCPRFILVIEVKNRSKDWHFAKLLNQVTVEGKRVKNPILQAKVQSIKLKRWLAEHHFTDIPILYLFVNSNEKSKIHIDYDHKYSRSVCNSEQLIEKIEQIENQLKTEILEEKDLRKINRLLLAKNTPDNTDLLQHFKLTSEDQMTGIRCQNKNTKCNSSQLRYKSGIWTCPVCKLKSKTAHHQKIKDYFLLIKPTITNTEARALLQIKSRKIIHQMLTNMNLPYTGKFKGRVYHQPKEQ
jgi:ribosomal protein L37AE/L43A